MVNLQEIRNKVNDSKWRYGTYGLRPSSTFAEIVSDSFDNVKQLGNNARHCRLDEMYSPDTGSLRRSTSYSELSPTNGMSWIDRHIVGPDLRPYKPYQPKQGEWRQVSQRNYRSLDKRVSDGLRLPESHSLPLPPRTTPFARGVYTLPADNSRIQNFRSYWRGRADGLEYTQPMLYEHNDNYTIEEDRRYNKLPWAPYFIDAPTVRHGRQVMLIPYI